MPSLIPCRCRLIRSSTGSSASLLSPNSSFWNWNRVMIPMSLSASALVFPFFRWNRTHGSPWYSTSSHFCGTILITPVVFPHSSRVFTRNTLFRTPRIVAVWYWNLVHSWKAFGRTFSLRCSSGFAVPFMFGVSFAAWRPHASRLARISSLS